MTAAGYLPGPNGTLRLDWTRAKLGDDSLPCVHCGKSAILRHPQTGRPCHKDCGDQAFQAEYAATEQRLTARATANRTQTGA